jgi:hypothetical protein
MSSPLDDDLHKITIDFYLTHHVPRFEQLTWEIQDTEDWIKRFLEEQNLATPEEIIGALEKAIPYSSENPPAWTEKLNTSEKSNLEISENFRSRKAYWHFNRVEELEKALSTLRQWMINNFKAAESKSKPLILSFERERKLFQASQLKKS